PQAWIEAAQQSPIYKMIVDWKIALPLHPEYRTLPMVWYIPPLSPITNMIEGKGSRASEYDIFPAIDEMRIPIEYLANLLTAGDQAHIRTVLKK
ncbi:nitrate reductase subunit beta, partial [Escherichia coli]|nr:nitrate reductase subunit beta [Escherichia coli]